jgi:hypothetical protein
VTAIPWFRSPQTIGLITTFIAAAVALFPKAGVLLGLTTPGAIQTAVENIAGVIALLAPVVGTVFRVKSTLQPITLTQAAADVHPVTIAAHVPPPVSTVMGNYSTPVTIRPTAPVPIPGKPWGKP